MSTFLFLKDKKSQYVWHRKEFDEIDVETTDRLMGEHLMDRKPVVYKCVCVCGVRAHSHTLIKVMKPFEGCVWVSVELFHLYEHEESS